MAEGRWEEVEGEAVNEEVKRPKAGENEFTSEKGKIRSLSVKIS